MKKSLLIFFLLLVLSLAAAIFWFWWQRPRPSDLANDVPAETLIYIEADHLPQTVSDLAATDAWKTLDVSAKVGGFANQASRLSAIPFYTGLGSAETVVFARAQVALAVLGFDTSERGEEDFKVVPRVALIIDTHTSAERTRVFVERQIGSYARRTFKATQVETGERDGGVAFLTWRKPGNNTKTIYAALNGSIATIGNDEASVLACLRAQKGQGASLAASQELRGMRERMRSTDATIFGYASSSGVSTLLQSLARIYIERAADQRAQGLAASLLPQLSKRILGAGGGGWSARFVGGAVEDRYYLSLQPHLTDLLTQIPKKSARENSVAANLLPADSYQMTRYYYADPEAAWSALGVALAARLDTLSAVIVTEFLKNSLEPYGIASPKDFLRAVGPEITIARLDDAGQSTITLATITNEAALRALVTKRLGARYTTERVDGAELLVSADDERGAACFTNNMVLLGAEKTLRQCLAARAQHQVIAEAKSYKRALDYVAADATVDAATLTDDRENARAVVASLIPDEQSREAFRRDALPALQQLPLAVTTTQLNADGVERVTRSAFGQFATIAQQLSASAAE